MLHPELPIISFLCFVMVLTVLPAHLRAGSVATIALIAWLSIMSLIRGIDSLIWADNFDIKVPVWCDITTKITVGFNLAVPTASLCVLKHLASIASESTVCNTSAEKKRRQNFEGVMCFGFPIVYMALHYIVQGHRFDVYEYFGCQPTIYYSLASIFLYYGPPLLMSCISFVFASLSLYRFLRLRINFSLHLRNSSALSASQYFRLMAMAVIVNTWDTGINAYIIVYTNQLDGGLRPWISWENVHSNWSFIAVYPTELFPPSIFAQVLFVWWIVPISCFIFFFFFGFGSETIADYRAAGSWVWTKVMRRKVKHSQVLPLNKAYVHHVTLDTSVSPPHRKLWHDSTSGLEVKPDLYPISDLSPATSSTPPNAHEAASRYPHSYSIETDSATSYSNFIRSRDDHRNVAVSAESTQLRKNACPRNASAIEAQILGGIDVDFSPSFRESWKSSQSYDNQDHPPQASNDSTHDFIIVPRTLSLDLIPRVS